MTEPTVAEQHAFLDDAKNRDWRNVRQKLEHKPDLINAQPCMRWSALHQAAAEGNEETIAFLLEHKADINYKVASGTPLDVAKASVKWMFEQKPELTEKEEHEFLDAAKAFKWDVVKSLLVEKPPLLNVQPCGRWSTLHQAAHHGNKEIVNFLLGLNADVGLKTKDDKTALEVAKKSVKPLLEAAKPKPACEHGASCCIHLQTHLDKFGHAVDKKLAGDIETKANAAWGDGKWQINTEGDALDDDGWEDVGKVFPIDGPLYRFLNESGLPSGAFYFEELDQEARVDFSLLSATVKSENARGQSAMVRWPLRRLNAKGEVSHPKKGEKHPLDVQLEQEKEGAVDDFLTNEFFFKAFCKAVKQGGGKIDFGADDLFDSRFNEEWQNLSLEETKVERRGGVLYRTPAGWKRFAIKCKDKYGDNTWLNMKGEEGEWAVAYHGTAMKVVPLIIKNGFKSGSGQGAASCKDVRTNKLVGKGIYCTPNLRTVECYANGNEDGGSEQKESAATIDGHTLFFALQCRIRPGGIRRPDRHFARNNDEEIMGIDGVFEWVVDPDDIRPYAILVRDKAGSDHRPLGKLIGGGQWNKTHKPLAHDSFAHVLGRRDSAKDIQRSYLQAVKALKK